MNGIEDTTSWNHKIDDGKGGDDRAVSISISAQGGVFVVGYAQDFYDQLWNYKYMIKTFNATP